MRTVVFGKKIETVYSVDYKWEQIDDAELGVKTVYTGKPEIKTEKKLKEWCELCNYEGEPRYNSNKSWWMNTNGFGLSKQMNISENETVNIEEEIFRADLHEMHLHTDKIIEETDVNKEESYDMLESQIKEFNRMMISSNDRLKSYCDLHKLAYEETDCIELFKLIYPGKQYVIEDGVMKESCTKTFSCGGFIKDNDIAYCTSTISLSGR